MSFFRSIALAVKKVTQQDYRPKSLVTDAAGEISNGFMRAYLYKSTEEFKFIFTDQYWPNLLITF